MFGQGETNNASRVLQVVSGNKSPFPVLVSEVRMRAAGLYQVSQRRRVTCCHTAALKAVKVAVQVRSCVYVCAVGVCPDREKKAHGIQYRVRHNEQPIDERKEDAAKQKLSYANTHTYRERERERFQ